MLRFYKTNAKTKDLEKIDHPETDCWMDLVAPTESEIETVLNTTHIDEDLIRKMLDDDEIPRIETSENATMTVIDVPIADEDGEYITNPVGIIVTDNNFLITISPSSATVFNIFRDNKMRDFRTAKKTRFLIQVLNIAAAEYLKVLDEVYREIETKEEVLKKSTRNEDLIDLLATEKTLVYFMSSLKENALVLERLGKGIVLPLYEGDIDLLEDAEIENRQAIDMAGIYREILSSITDTYATIVSNNLNNVMKFLAGMTIVVSVPTIISSFFGMNVTFGVIASNPFSALALLVLSILASVTIAIILKKKGLL